MQPFTDQTDALRFVAFVDRLYDAQVRDRRDGTPLDQVFGDEMLAGGYRKKYLRAVSRLVALTLAPDGPSSERPRPPRSLAKHAVHTAPILLHRRKQSGTAAKHASTTLRSRYPAKPPCSAVKPRRARLGAPEALREPLEQSRGDAHA